MYEEQPMKTVRRRKYNRDRRVQMGRDERGNMFAFGVAVRV